MYIFPQAQRSARLVPLLAAEGGAGPAPGAGGAAPARLPPGLWARARAVAQRQAGYMIIIIIYNKNVYVFDLFSSSSRRSVARLQAENIIILYNLLYLYILQCSSAGGPGAGNREAGPRVGGPAPGREYYMYNII